MNWIKIRFSQKIAGRWTCVWQKKKKISCLRFQNLNWAIKSPLSDQIRLYVGSTQAKGSKIFGIKRQIDTQKYGVTSSKKVLGVTVVLGVERSQKQSVIQGFGGDETKFNFQLSF